MGRQRKNLDLLAELNERRMRGREHSSDLAARMRSYELAFQMQMEAPSILDISGETEDTRALYGMDREHSAEFGRRCLLARRLVERGTRFVHLFTAGWDSHDYIDHPDSTNRDAK